jgi:hypothetical protein
MMMAFSPAGWRAVEHRVEAVDVDRLQLVAVFACVAHALEQELAVACHRRHGHAADGRQTLDGRRRRSARALTPIARMPFSIALAVGGVERAVRRWLLASAR